MRALRILPIALLVLTSSCVGGTRPAHAAALQSFPGCGPFLSYVKREALDRVTAWGLPGTGGVELFAEGAVDAATSEEAGAPLLGAREPGVDYSETNVQVAGVDEPDIVKTDGSLLFALAQGRLFVVDLTGVAPRQRGSLSLRGFQAGDMLLSGDRILLLGYSGASGVGIPEAFREPFDLSGYGGLVSVLAEVDVSDPDQPRMGRKMFLDGSYLSARLIDDVARVVVSSYPSLPFEFPEREGLRAERAALELNRSVIRSSTIEDWVPYFVLEDEAGGTVSEGALLDCASSYHPDEFSGFGMLTVVTLDLARGLEAPPAESSVGVLSGGETIYASADALYVATQRWVDWEALEEGRGDLDEGHRTHIHRFDISGPGAAEYRSSGAVSGWLLNQFAMDEHEGHLRVASTDAPPFWGDEGSSESMVTTLAERGSELREVGQVSGLGKGERIFSVRFMGDLGYVVTFREVDPLYVIDLSDPAAPTVEGELKILGYSAYLHPLGEDRLLGVGQDATREGMLKGTQLSLFDVSDAADPQRIDTVQVSDGSSEVEWDHHAFLYWEPTGLVVVPVNVYGWDELTGEETDSFFGAIAIRVQGDGLERAGRLRQQEGDWESQIRRSLVVGDRLYTMSERGIEASELDTLEDVAWLPFE